MCARKAAPLTLHLRSSTANDQHHALTFDPTNRTVSLAGGQSLTDVAALDRPFTLDIIQRDNLLDLCIDDRRTLVNAVPHLTGDRLILSVENGQATLSEISATPLR